MALIRRMVNEFGPVAHPSSEFSNMLCRFCYEDMGAGPHMQDCAWRAAKEYVDGLENT